ncbi:metal-dependent hydrolase [Halocalculus aciditolerans]|uniref:Uncharacterized protein n=1 Tax=Halocalculus aciditolerans TaxID=1383812 RepID=A0A830F9E3_9EURY|nr:metal-dependent hydrolase [Halocalculus aciditolerans]GGL52951.1 hypothetical protein GCM10009039_08940 [Halocalculus aciditolerans]
MFIGHETVAFAVVALAAVRLGVSKERALALGVAAGLFAAVPDADMVYALSGLLSAQGGVFGATEAFWAASTAVHRTITHSVVLAAPAALAFALLHDEQTTFRAAGWTVLVGVAGVAFLVSGPLALLVTAAFAAAGRLVLLALDRYVTPALSARDVGVAAFAGLATHPFGDYLTGHPPDLLYPLPIHILTARPDLFGDETLNLLAAFGFELACIWAGVLVALHLLDRDPRDYVSPKATAGIAYAAVAFVVTPPTLDLSYPFVFSVLAVGVVGVTPDYTRRLPDAPTAALTGLAAVTLAGVAYLATYLGFVSEYL